MDNLKESLPDGEMINKIKDQLKERGIQIIGICHISSSDHIHHIMANRGTDGVIIIDPNLGDDPIENKSGDITEALIDLTKASRDLDMEIKQLSVVKRFDFDNSEHRGKHRTHKNKYR